MYIYNLFIFFLNIIFNLFYIPITPIEKRQF